jgi:hypothetical protein
MVLAGDVPIEGNAERQNDGSHGQGLYVFHAPGYAIIEIAWQPEAF